MNPIGKSLLAAASLAVLLGIGWWAIERAPNDLQRTQSDEIQAQWLAETQASARLLSEQFVATGNVNAALAMLDLLEARIGPHPAQEKLMRVRLALASDRQRLLSVKALDLAQAAAQIEVILLDIDSLPLLSTPVLGKPAPADAGTTPSPAGLPGAREIIDSIKARLADLIRIRRVENPEAVLLSSEQGALVAERLRLRLLSARVALLGRQDKVFAQDIAQAERILGDVFDPQNSRVIAHRKTLAGLKGLSEKMPAPIRLGLVDALEALAASEAAPR